MKSYIGRPAVAVVFCAALLAAYSPGQIQAAESTSTKSGKKAATGTAVKRATTMKLIPGSGETAKERSTRLKRECKGAVNAGACEGYTR